MEIGIREAKNSLSRLLEAVQQGEDVFLTNRGARVAQLVAAGPSVGSRMGRGFLKGKLNLYPGWDSQEEDAKIAQAFETSARQ